jgi:hypothetical protein
VPQRATFGTKLPSTARPYPTAVLPRSSRTVTSISTSCRRWANGWLSTSAVTRFFWISPLSGESPVPGRPEEAVYRRHRWQGAAVAAEVTENVRKLRRYLDEETGLSAAAIIEGPVLRPISKATEPCHAPCTPSRSTPSCRPPYTAPTPTPPATAHIHCAPASSPTRRLRPHHRPPNSTPLPRDSRHLRPHRGSLDRQHRHPTRA